MMCIKVRGDCLNLGWVLLPTSPVHPVEILLDRLNRLAARSFPSSSSTTDGGLRNASAPLADPPHLLQRLNVDLRREFLKSQVAGTGSSKEIAVRLRGWACITRAHRAEVIDLLNERDYFRVSLRATWRAVSKSVDFTVLPWNQRDKVEHALNELVRTYRSLHVDLGSSVNWFHTHVSHFDALGVLFAYDPPDRRLQIDFSGTGDLDQLMVATCISRLREASGADPEMAAPAIDLTWKRANMDGPFSTLLLHLANDERIANRFRTVALPALRIESRRDNWAAARFQNEMASWLCKTTRLVALSLRHTPLAWRLNPLIPALEKNASLAKLDLGHCALMDEDASALEALLERNQRV